MHVVITLTVHQDGATVEIYTRKTLKIYLDFDVKHMSNVLKWLRVHWGYATYFLTLSPAYSRNVRIRDDLLTQQCNVNLLSLKQTIDVSCRLGFVNVLTAAAKRLICL